MPATDEGSLRAAITLRGVVLGTAPTAAFPFYYCGEGAGTEIPLGCETLLGSLGDRVDDSVLDA